MNVSEGDTFLFIFVGPFQWRHYFSKHSVFFPFRTKEYKSLKCLKENVLYTQWKKAVRVLCIIIRNHLIKLFVCVLYAKCKRSMSSGCSSLVLMKKSKHIFVFQRIDMAHQPLNPFLTPCMQHYFGILSGMLLVFWKSIEIGILFHIFC